jgi:hypothetical protein
MKKKLQGLGFVMLLGLIWNTGATHAQTAVTTTKPIIPLRYDVSKEVTLSAIVQSVPSKSSHGLVPDSGSKSGFVLETASGAVEGSLTPFVLNGKGALSISVGEQIQVTGVMTTRNNKQLFLIRTIQVGGHTYAIRNERGFPLEHPANNTSAAPPSTGGQL